MVGTHTFEKLTESSDAEAFSHITEHRHLLDAEAFSHITEHQRLLLTARLTRQSHTMPYFEGQKSPDIIFLQEVTPDVRASLLDDARVRPAFLVTDAEDQRHLRRCPLRP